MKEGQQFLDALASSARMMHKQAQATCAAHPDEAALLLDPLARWSQAAFGDDIFPQAAKGYARYCMTVAQAQRAYEATDVYNPQSLSQIKQSVYEDPAYMIPYMWAAILIYPFWPSMIEHVRLYRWQFLQALPAAPRVLELGCGHGVLGLLAAQDRPDATVHGIDLSRSAIEIAEKLRSVSGLGPRVRVEVQDATRLHSQAENGAYHGIIFAMLAEHVEAPAELMSAVKRNLAPDGIAYFSTAIESAQPDHVFEFHSEAETIALAERAGLRARSMVSSGSRALPDSKYRPRAVAMILEHR
jgi:2-polyprenyl-3-methyl-5-hydroxy-6-metoxy-1,4-benzoquinol methylase